MSISTTEILGTDSLSGSRIVINDNFKFLTSEINQIENYMNPDAGTITGLNDLTTRSLTVGLNSPLLSINATTFDIFADVRITGNIKLDGGSLIRNNSNTNVIDDLNGSTAEIGTSTVSPENTIYKVANLGGTGSTSLTVTIHDGEIGQELIVVYSENSTEPVNLQGSTPFILPAGGTTVVLNAQGQTTHFLAIDDGTGNPVWYLIGGVGYTIQ